MLFQSIEGERMEHLNQKGQATIFMVLAVSLILMFTGKFIQDKFLENVKLKTKILTKQNMEVYMQNVHADLNNEQVWKEIIRENKEQFKCLFNYTCLTDKEEKEITLTTLDGQKIADGEYIGFDKNGNTCLFSDFNCIYKLRMKWRPDCTDVNCINPIVRLLPELEEKSGNILKTSISINIVQMATDMTSSRSTSDLIFELKGEGVQVSK